MTKAIPAGFLIGLLLLVLMPVFSQQTGEIRGIVTDDAKSPLPGVGITARSPKLQGLRTAISGQDGSFRLPLLPVGSYTLTFELPGFEKLTTSGNDVRLGFTASMAVVLNPAAVSEEVTVTAQNPLFDKTDSDNSFRLKGDEIATVPAQGRTIEEIVSCAPGVTGVRSSSVTGRGTGLPSFRGEGEAGNNWIVDGLSMKGANLNDLAVRVNYDAWEEVEITSDGFDPELGQALGGFVNIVTKSGGNEFHGEVGSLIQDPHLRAQQINQLSVATLPETSIRQYFGNLGGAVLKDKLWFFFSDNFLQTSDTTEEQTVGWLTIPSGSRMTKTNNLFGKLTFTPHKNHILSLNGTLDKLLSQTGGIGVPETYDRFAYTDSYFRLNYTANLSSTMLLTAALGQYHSRSETEPSNGDFGPARYTWLDIGQNTNNAFSYQSQILKRTDFSANFILYLDPGKWGDHEIGAGFSAYDNSRNADFRGTGRDFDLWPGNSYDNGAFLTWVSPGNPLSLVEIGEGAIKNSTRGIGLYLKDAITLGRFSLTLGARSDTQIVYSDVGKKVWTWDLGDFISPRISLAFDVSGNGENILKFGYGRFATPQSTSALWLFNRHNGSAYAYHSWVGSANPSAEELRDPSAWELIFATGTAGHEGAVDPRLKPNRSTKFLAEFDRQLGKDWAVKVRGVYSFAKNLTEDILVYDPESFNGTRYLYTNFALKRRNYKALELELKGEVNGRLRFQASYTWSQAKGTIPGQDEYSGRNLQFWYFAEAGAFGDHPLVPDGAPEKQLLDAVYQGYGGVGIGDEGWYGFLPYSVDHLFKLLAFYQAPLGINISASVEFISGYHWERRGLNPFQGFYITFPEGRGGRTTPPHLYLDLIVEKEFLLNNKMRLSAGVNVYNLFNSQRPVSFVNEDTELFGQVWARQLPRWVQLQMSLRF